MPAQKAPNFAENFSFLGIFTFLGVLTPRSGAAAVHQRLRQGTGRGVRRVGHRLGEAATRGEGHSGRGGGRRKAQRAGQPVGARGAVDEACGGKRPAA